MIMPQLRKRRAWNYRPSSARVLPKWGGNKYRLVVEMQYRAGIAWVKFMGTHEQYDRINVESVNAY